MMGFLGVLALLLAMGGFREAFTDREDAIEDRLKRSYSKSEARRASD